MLKGVLTVLVVTVLPVLAFRWISPFTSSFMLQARANGADVAYDWVPWREISPQVALAVIAAEDQKFREHDGFDLGSIADALDDRARGGRVRGASTISQQVAKNLFLWPEKSWLRKGLEAYFTVLIEALWPKRRILEVYLNLAQFGRDVFGVGAASAVYFGKPPSAIQPEEAALLAAVLPDPRRMRVARPSPYVQKRVIWILGQMQRLGGRSQLRGL